MAKFLTSLYPNNTARNRTILLDRIFVRPNYTLHYRRAPSVRWASAARADYQVMVLLDGSLKAKTEEVIQQLESGGAVLLNPGDEATATGKTAEYLTLDLSSTLVFDCALRSRFVTSGARIDLRGPVLEGNAGLDRLARELATELLNAEAGQELVVAALVEQTVIHLLRHHANVHRADEMELSRAGLVDRRIRRAVELMHAKLGEDLALDEIAAAAYLSPFHFARLFKKLTGSAPHAYLAALRATRAQTLLAETDLSVTEIAARVGYASPSHFTKAFRQATGLVPRAFRAALIT
ncbi:MAG: AraC family transcriptional regulator [Pyrinomonadaceae bacterium]